MSTLQSRRRKKLVADTWYKPLELSKFKCSMCGEIDYEIAIRYCGNTDCKYKT